jgi:competence protein ComEA
MEKDRLRSLFTFTKQERRGVYVLISLLAVAWMLPFLSERKTRQVEGVEWHRLQPIDSQSNGSSPQEPRYKTEKTALRRQRWQERRFQPPAEVFPFDPNKTTEEEWLRLGLTDRQARTILNYVSKGGRFRSAEDLKRIYGFPVEAFAVLSPHVRIVSAAQSSGRGSFPDKVRGAPPRERSRRMPASLGINTADSAAWESLPGIGPFLASRIIRFRSRLGGFHSVAQVGETFGLPDSVFRRILPLLVEESGAFSPGLDVNAATLDELKSHPYLTHRLARSIVAYREQHGAFQKPEDLLAIETLTPDQFDRLKPYVLIR